jgi:hypothetical protein
VPPKPLSFYLQEARLKLVSVVESYRLLDRRAEIEQHKKVGEGYEHLIWFLFPSEALEDILRLRYQAPLTFESLESLKELRNGELNLLQSQTVLPFYSLDLN